MPDGVNWQSRRMLGKRLIATIGRGAAFGVPLLLLLFAFMIGNATGAPGVRARNASSQSFSINDFDGDHHPDLANLQTAQSRPGASRYFIQLQLSATEQHSLYLEGPSGGLVIEARDVNGDNSPDLVLKSSLYYRPVAIFLNDGHGNFSPSILIPFLVHSINSIGTGVPHPASKPRLSARHPSHGLVSVGKPDS